MSRLSIVCIAVLSSLAFLLVADPLISCGPDQDPYDYYTSFFQHKMESQLGMRPFYYTSARFLYDDTDQVTVEQATCAEWASYLGSPVTQSEAYTLICSYSDSVFPQLQTYMTSPHPEMLSDSLASNAMVARLVETHNLAAVKYLSFARTVRPFVAGSQWWYEPVERDSLAMLKFASSAEKLLSKEKDEFIRQRYAYQALRLNYYARSFKRADAVYAKYFAKPTGRKILDLLVLSIKAGILYHAKQKAEAAYLYSKAFGDNPTAKISNFVSFGWCLDSTTPESAYYQFCKDTREAANMAALFALHNPGNAFDDMKKVVGFDAGCPALEVLAVREIHKIEEMYLSPRLNQAKGAIQLFTSFSDANPQTMSNSRAEATDLISFYERLANDPRCSNPSLFEIGAAYLAVIVGRYDDAERLCTTAAAMAMTEVERDQLQLTRLLLTVNRQNRFDNDFEAKLLPSVQWLEEKATHSDEWAQFYRNLFTSVLAPRYLVEGKSYKTVLAFGRGERRPKLATDTTHEERYGYFLASLDYLRQSMSSTELESLQSFLTQRDHTPFEDYLIRSNTIDRNEVFDCIGTSYLRTFNWQKAAEWFRKISPEYFQKDVFKTYLGANCFSDVIQDTHAATVQDTVVYTKLSFAQRMIALESAQSPSHTAAERAQAYYTMACGMYHMSYYGNSWMLMQYSWTSNEYPIIDSIGSRDWRREYYGAFRAEDYFNKALALTDNRDMKAKCLFMAARCDQKQHLEGFTEAYGTLKEFPEGPNKDIFRRFLFNPTYFPPLVESYSNTQFFQEAVNTCSYLKDYYEAQTIKK